MNNGISIKDWFDVDIQNVMVFYANNSGINVVDSANVNFENVYVEGCGGTEYGGATPLVGVGISLVGSKDCYLEACYSDTNTFGFLIKSNPSNSNMPRNLFLTQCEATLCQQSGISIANANGMVLSDSLVEGSFGDGALIVDSFGINVANSVFQGNSGNGLAVNSLNADLSESLITISNCDFDANTKNGIGLYSQNQLPLGSVSITGCQITNSGEGDHGNPDQPFLWDGMNINTDSATGGNCNNILVSNCFLGNRDGTNPTQEYGIRTLGNTDYVQLFQNNFFNNLGGNYTLVGTHNTIQNGN